MNRVSVVPVASPGAHNFDAILAGLKADIVTELGVQLAVTLAYRILAGRGFIEVEERSMTAHVHCLPWLLCARVVSTSEELDVGIDAIG